jgi:hypothetical protein
VEAVGNSSLSCDDESPTKHYFIKYSTNDPFQITADLYGMFIPLGVEKVGDTYTVALKYSYLYFVWEIDGTGAQVNTLRAAATWDVDMYPYETLLSQDLNNDGYIGSPP